MSTVPKIVDITTTPARPARAFLRDVIDTMARIHRDQGRSIFALTAPNRRAGTSYVVNLLAEELVSQFEATVGIVPAAAFKGVDATRIPQGFVEHAPNIWTAVSDQTLENMPDFALEGVCVSSGGSHCDFILIDCPALDCSSQALRSASIADGIFLVVEAGVTRTEQIEAAVRLLDAPPARRLQGIILNRRTYPIPKFLYQLL
ncbi:MAG TPA: hypothetical protein VGL53_03980 [Bryobacteraceae bacterium]